ncbi:hypothetical protein JCM10908_001916 [Rhodotorula pacifica]|uniref:uncharacterized protein n=1 Tax=Rhodotorula pacifica TaxID=1495444 RepID=UPI00317BD2E4
MRPIATLAGSEPWSSRPSLSSLATSTSPGSAADESTSPPTSEDGSNGGISPFASPSVSPPRNSSFAKYQNGRSMAAAGGAGGGDEKRFKEEAALALAAEEGTLRIPSTSHAGTRTNNGGAGLVSASLSAELERGPAARTRAFASNQAAEPTWDDVLTRARMAFRRWRHVYDREGISGIANDIRNRSVLSTRQTLHTARTSSPVDSLRSLIAVIPPRRRILILATVSLVTLFLLLSPSDTIGSSRRLGPGRGRRGATAAKSHELLKSSSSALALVPAGYPRSANKAKILESVSNPYGYMNLVDPYVGGAFNPSILVLPDQAGLGWRHVFVSRGEEKYEVIQGEDTRWEKLIGCFLLPMTRAHLELPYLARESELWTLDLPAKRKVEYMRCHNPDFNQFIGPEDPRLFFTNDGQPLLIYSQNGRMPNVCRALYVIDARMVIPGLDKALQRAGWNAPVQFREQTDLIRENQYNIEKNWSPFLGENDELFFHVSLVPQQIYKYVPNLTLRPLDPLAPSHNCLTDLLGADMNRVHLHHATPLLRATLCKRGECVPDVHNTVMFGMIHVKYHPLPYLHYVRHIVTWNTTAPYEYLSVSKPLTYSGTNQADPIFTVSMAWDKPSKRHGLGLNHGFLDDTVLISFGVADYGSAYIDVRARDLLTDHNLCAGVGGTSLWRHS